MAELPPSGDSQTLRTRQSGDNARIELFGEIDHGVAHRIDTAISDALNTGATKITVDFHHLTFFDSACIAALLRARDALLRTRGHLTLVNLTPNARRILELTGLTSVFTIERGPMA
jgi:stage II sporulation protein AA (anti-sigma F factor antagonist)